MNESCLQFSDSAASRLRALMSIRCVVGRRRGEYRIDISQGLCHPVTKSTPRSVGGFLTDRASYSNRRRIGWRVARGSVNMTRVEIHPASADQIKRRSLKGPRLRPLLLVVCFTFAGLTNVADAVAAPATSQARSKRVLVVY